MPSVTLLPDGIPQGYGPNKEGSHVTEFPTLGKGVNEKWMALTW